MEEIRDCSTARLIVLNVTEACHWEITDKELTLPARFATNLFRYVADRQIERIARSVAEKRQLRLVGRYDERYDRGS